MLEATLFPLAAVLYSIAILSQCRTDVLQSWALKLFYMGLSVDTFATFYVCVWRTGGDFIPTTVHGWAGYVALGIMAIHALYASIVMKRGTTEDLVTFRHGSHVAWMIWWAAFATGVPGDHSLFLLMVGGWFAYCVAAIVIWFSHIIPMPG